MSESVIAHAVKLDVLRPGDWIEMRYGFDRCPFYVLRNDPTSRTIRFTSAERNAVGGGNSAQRAT